MSTHIVGEAGLCDELRSALAGAQAHLAVLAREAGRTWVDLDAFGQRLELAQESLDGASHAAAQVAAVVERERDRRRLMELVVEERARLRAHGCDTGGYTAWVESLPDEDRRYLDALILRVARRTEQLKCCRDATGV